MCIASPRGLIDFSSLPTGGLSTTKPSLSSAKLSPKSQFFYSTYESLNQPGRHERPLRKTGVWPRPLEPRAPREKPAQEKTFRDAVAYPRRPRACSPPESSSHIPGRLSSWLRRSSDCSHASKE